MLANINRRSRWIKAGVDCWSPEQQMLNLLHSASVCPGRWKKKKKNPSPDSDRILSHRCFSNLKTSNNSFNCGLEACVLQLAACNLTSFLSRHQEKANQTLQKIQYKTKTNTVSSRRSVRDSEWLLYLKNESFYEFTVFVRFPSTKIRIFRNSKWTKTNRVISRFNKTPD